MKRFVKLGPDARSRAAKTGWHIRRAVEKRDFRTALGSTDRNRGPGLLARWITDDKLNLTRAELAAIMPQVWCMPEWPERQLEAWIWVMWFRRAGFVSDPAGIAPPTAPMTIHRGCLPDRQRGMAWTRDPAIADFFARRNREYFRLGPATVYTATIEPGNVLALIDGRSESEVVVDPAGLGDIRDVGFTPSAAGIEAR